MSDTHSSQPRSASWRTVFDVVSTIVTIALALIVISHLRSAQTGGVERSIPLPQEPLAVDGFPAKGSLDARVGVMEFSDFQCPFCARAANGVSRTLDREYVHTGEVLWLFRNLPLPAHDLAYGAAEAALCASSQGKFWEMHDVLFQTPGNLADAGLLSLAVSIGLDAEQYERCRTEGRTAALVDADLADAERFGFTSTPTYLFGHLGTDGRLRATDIITGARPISEYRSILDGLLAR